MRYLILILFLLGCNYVHDTYTDDPLIVVSCRYKNNGKCAYHIGDQSWSDKTIVIIDTCGKYNVGDTVEFKTIKGNAI